MMIHNVSRADSLYYKYRTEITQAQSEYDRALCGLNNAKESHRDISAQEFIVARDKLGLLISDIRKEWLYREAKAVR